MKRTVSCRNFNARGNINFIKIRISASPRRIKVTLTPSLNLRLGVLRVEHNESRNGRLLPHTPARPRNRVTRSTLITNFIMSQPTPLLRVLLRFHRREIRTTILSKTLIRIRRLITTLTGMAHFSITFKQSHRKVNNLITVTRQQFNPRGQRRIKHFGLTSTNRNVRRLLLLNHRLNLVTGHLPLTPATLINRGTNQTRPVHQEVRRLPRLTPHGNKLYLRRTRPRLVTQCNIKRGRRPFFPTPRTITTTHRIDGYWFRHITLLPTIRYPILPVIIFT